MNNNLEIKIISTQDTLEIRHKVMWPNKPVKYIELPDDDIARHFGLFVNGEITSIISLFSIDGVVQFRKFATLNKYQGLGFGSLLLKNIIKLLEKENIKKLWCNARVEKKNFYKNFNLKTTNKLFKKGNIEYVVMERYFIQKN